MDSILNWDSIISVDGKTLLPEGDYHFEVTGFSQGFHSESSGLPSCPQANLTLSVFYDGQIVEVKDHLYLCKRLEWRLVQFFRSLGLFHGTSGKMQWDKVLHAKGKCHIVVKNVNSDDSVKQYNNVAMYLECDKPKESDNPDFLILSDDDELPF